MRFGTVRGWIFVLLLLLCNQVALFKGARAEIQARNQNAFTVPTFHCLGLYWSPEEGAVGREVSVRYRHKGTDMWNDGLPMRYNPIAETDEDLADYRGSIVHLAPATTYEVELQLAGTATSTRLTATTWSEEFPVGDTVRVSDRDTPLVITDSGKPHAWRVYDGRGATIDVRHKHDACITVDASYVILRGFTLKGAGAGEINRKSPIGAIRIEGGQDIIIEDCDISDWGRLDPATGFGVNYDSAIYSRCPTLERLIVQRCKLHHPSFDGSTWYEPTYPTHTRGPQCISLFNTAGNHVIRYNECYSDLEHMYNDIIGGGSNGSFHGSPGPDSDIYGNLVSHCWDDGLEVEGGNRNVRVWDNYITQSMMMIGNAATSIGPLYVWRNVCARSQWQPDATGGYFLKMGFAGGEQWMTGHMYIFHNTLFRSDDCLPTGGLGGNRIVKHTVSRNNILQVRTPQNRSASEATAERRQRFRLRPLQRPGPAGPGEARRPGRAGLRQPAPASILQQRPASSNLPRPVPVRVQVSRSPTSAAATLALRPTSGPTNEAFRRCDLVSRPTSRNLATPSMRVPTSETGPKAVTLRDSGGFTAA